MVGSESKDFKTVFINLSKINIKYYKLGVGQGNLIRNYTISNEAN